MKTKTPLIPFEDARREILVHTRPGPPVTLPLEQLLGTCLADPLIASHNLPHFDNSAMDGYGVRVADVTGASMEQPVRLRIVATVQAGETLKQPLQPGEAIRIFTGAPVPPGVEAVVMQEYCEGTMGEVRVQKPVRAGENIRLRGEEFRAGDTILPEGTRITPPVIGLLAGSGHSEFSVYSRPKITLISTGNELVPPGMPLAPGQIHDSNSHALATALTALHLPAPRIVHVPDEYERTCRLFEEALAASDVVITLGGISVGDFDYVKSVVEASGVETLFWGVAIKPGKPVYFGKTREGKLVFGLPGNPVSALVTFHLFVQPALRRMLGDPSPLPACRNARLTTPLQKKPGKLEFVRGVLSVDDTGKEIVTPTRGQDSHMLSGLARANCLICFPAERESLSAGEWVSLEPLNWV